MELLNFKNKVAIITGNDQGIGLKCGSDLANREVFVVVINDLPLFDGSDSKAKMFAD